ncbi:MAG: hypothetical protein MJ223_02095 [Mycoplasmoidaceae bacterium]|nr:hypothetical protein [Mycoplasmoidaceae bacterium]
MLKFEENRIHEIGIVDKRFDKQIPIIAVDPKIITNESVVFIYSGGVGNTNSICKYMNNLAFDENYFISYEKAGHGNNTNKTSQYRKKSIKELDAVVD